MSLVLAFPFATMAPPLKAYPVSEIEERAQYHTIDMKERRRKVRNFDLETCELFELVQYTCTTLREHANRAAVGSPNVGKTDCYPLIRLFRRYVQNSMRRISQVVREVWKLIS